MRRGVAILLAFVVAVGAAPAAALEPFAPGSHAQILAEHRDRPLVLAFWSLTCSHCVEELPLLGELARRHPRAAFVLVSTDTPEDAAAIAETLRAQGIERLPSWVFAGAAPERLRYEVDRRWRGELPRTYLYGRGGSVQAVSGKLDRGMVERWLRAELSRPGASSSAAR
jgi:thiol-disulfide isomerase/thioredoxin